tara:strand:+ start:33 stop:341 length:309 start_codon:yes stop_codon:yes gene_type:complete
MTTQMHSYGSMVKVENGKKIHDEEVSFHSDGEKGLIFGQKNGKGYYMKIDNIDDLFKEPASKKNLKTKLSKVLKTTRKRKKNRAKKTRRKRRRKKRKIFNFY